MSAVFAVTVPSPEMKRSSAAELSAASDTSGGRHREQHSHDALQFATLGSCCTSRSKSSRLPKQLIMLLASSDVGMAEQGGC